MGHNTSHVTLYTELIQDICNRYDGWSSYVKSALTSWWRHEMETFSALLTLCVGNSPVFGEFLAQMPVKRSFDFFFDLRLNKRLSKHWWGWWFETLSSSLWRHCNVMLRLGVANDTPLAAVMGEMWVVYSENIDNNAVKSLKSVFMQFSCWRQWYWFAIHAHISVIKVPPSRSREK